MYGVGRDPPHEDPGSVTPAFCLTTSAARCVFGCTHVPNHIKPDLDPPATKSRFAIAEVVLPQASERNSESQRLDGWPGIQKALPPLHEGRGVALAERDRPFDRHSRALRLRLQYGPRREHAPREDEALDEVRAFAVAIEERVGHGDHLQHCRAIG